MSNNRSIFVTGTGTGVGKTVVTGLLARFLSETGLSTVTQKWVQTGSRGFSEDIAVHLRLMGKSEKDFEAYLPHMAPYTFGFPSSPHLAARLENRAIDTKKILDSFYLLKNDFDAVVVEGTGGLMVPLNRREMVIDICEKARIPVLLVVNNGLGAINRTILSVEALRKRGIEILGLVFNRISVGEDETILKDNLSIINEFTGLDVYGELPALEDTDALYRAFLPMARKILKKLTEYHTHE